MNKEKRDIRIVFGVFCVIFILLAWSCYPHFISIILIGLSVILSSLLLFLPLILLPLYNLWMKFAHVLGKINTQIILFIAYIFLFLPFGLIMRAMRKDPMNRKLGVKESYWESLRFDGLNDKERYYKQF
jgi:hypothetical protein